MTIARRLRSRLPVALGGLAVVAGLLVAPGSAAAQEPPGGCPWWDAAVGLARSIDGVADPRAARIRAELERLGVTAGGAPPQYCGSGTGTDSGPFDPAVGRIAISVDGNEHDEDDWASSAMGLAILARGNLQGNVVHYDYGNHVWGSQEGHATAIRESVLGAVERYGFDPSRFFDDTDEQQLRAGTQNLVAQINASTADDRLALVLAGPMETAWMALEAADPQKRPYVRCVSHGRWNETHGADDHGGHSYDDLIELGCQRDQMSDQNSQLGPAGMGVWDFLKSDPNGEWLYSRIALPPKQGDISDAGMIFYVITGNKEATRDDVRGYLTG